MSWKGYNINFQSDDERESILEYDGFYHHNGYVLLKELIPDDDGFDKTWWTWGKCDDGYVVNPKHLEGLSSNAYAGINEAFEVFQKEVDRL
tara:strand:- start:44 stop:316 length:273 start_codon:yes stop_codon:yes gene_type:complete